MRVLKGLAALAMMLAMAGCAASNPPRPGARQGNAAPAQQQAVPQRYGGPASGTPAPLTGTAGGGRQVRQGGASLGDVGVPPPAPPLPTGGIR